MSLKKPEQAAAHAAWIREALAQYERPLLRYAARFTGDIESARDVVQDTFMKLCREDRVRLDGHLAAWLYTVCRNRARDVRKKEGRMQALEQHTAEARADSAPGPDDRAQTREEYRLVLDVLETLPMKQQEAFRLKFEHGLSYREIGRVMNLPLSTVSYTMSKAMTTLRTRLRPQIDDPTPGQEA